MAYTQPQLRVFQIFEAVLAAGITPLYSCIVGPQYGLHRYSKADEKALLGSYDNTGSNSYSYTDKATGSTVDTGTAELVFEDALLRYYNAAGTFAVPTGIAAGQNQIRASGLILTSDNGYTRSGTFGTRNVTVGDYVKVSWTGASTGTVESQVMQLIADQVASVGAATAYAGNQAGTGAIAPNVDSSTTVYPFDISAGGTYDGLAAGHVSETYTITCTKAGGSGTAEVSVVSTSGTDDVLGQVVTFTSTAIGTRGVTMTLGSATDSSSSSSGSGASPDEKILNLGDIVVIKAQMAYVAPTPASSGTYSGPANTQYIVKIVSGGVVGTDTIIYKVMTNNGVDVQPETAVTSAGAILIGNYGVLMTLVGATQYCGGDIWTINGVAETNGAVRTIVLADKLVDGSNQCAIGDTLTVTIALKDTVTMAAAFYTLTATQITVLGSATYTGTYHGTARVYPILAATMYISYRELLVDNVASLGSLTSASAVEAVLGPVDVLNPLAKGVYSALQNSNGVTVYYIAVATDDLEGYSTALDTTSTSDLVYSMAPLNKTQAVKDLFEAQVDDQSSAEKNNWRICWVNSAASEFQSIYTVEGSDPVMATITDPLSGSNYVQVTGADALFVTRGAKAGDILRYNYRPSNGETIYNTVVIESVDTENELTLATSADSAYPTEVKIEIWRTRTNTQFASAIGADSAAYANRRVRNIWPDVIEDADGNVVSGVYLCAALAGLRSGVAPHQPLTNVALSGFYSPTRSTMFTNTQLNLAAAGGTWIVTEDLLGTVYTRHQLTTDMTDINRQEDTLTTNLDSISRIFRDAFSPLIGKGNVSADMLALISIKISATAAYIQALPYPVIIGPQMQGYNVTLLAVDPLLRDRINIKIVPVLPYPLNNLDLTFIIQ
jgi:hypothetical protein